MTRLPLLDGAEHPELAQLIRDQRGGRLLALYRVLLHSPGVARAWLDFFTVIRQQCTLGDRLRELAILQVAVANRARYEFDQHVPFALRAGLTPADIESLREDRLPGAWTGADLAVLAYADAMTRSVQVPDAVFEAVRAHLPPGELVELTATVGGYNMVSRFLEAMDIHEEPPTGP